jgi:hypothetical protein
MFFVLHRARTCQGQSRPGSQEPPLPRVWPRRRFLPHRRSTTSITTCLLPLAMTSPAAPLPARPLLELGQDRKLPRPTVIWRGQARPGLPPLARRDDHGTTRSRTASPPPSFSFVLPRSSITSGYISYSSTGYCFSTLSILIIIKSSICYHVRKADFVLVMDCLVSK